MVTAVLVYALTLFVSVLLSGLARRSVLSTAVIFLVAGFLTGQGVLGLVSLDARNPIVMKFAELALVAVLFVEAIKVDPRKVARHWRLPARALLLGVPLTMLVIGAFGWLVVGLSWPVALLVGAILSPTDPVFAAGIVRQPAVPEQSRRLLNIESGLNDGLALPLVLVSLALVQGAEAPVVRLLLEVLFGVVLGIVVAWAAVRLQQLPFIHVADLYKPLSAFAVGLLVLALANLTGANEFLAVFSAGFTIAWLDPGARDAFREFGDLLSELLKLGAVLLFGQP